MIPQKTRIKKIPAVFSAAPQESCIFCLLDGIRLPHLPADGIQYLFSMLFLTMPAMIQISHEIPHVPVRKLQPK